MELLSYNYPAIIVKDLNESIDFYQKLGASLIYSEPNRDDHESIQVMMSIGEDNFLMLVGPQDPKLKLAESSLGVGSVQYISFNVNKDFIDQAFFELSKVGLHGSEEIVRGYERLIFLEDPNGVLILLTSWTVDVPNGMNRATILKLAGDIRNANGDTFIETLHIQTAINELNSDITQN